MILFLIGFGVFNNKTNSQANQNLDKFLSYPSLKQIMHGTTEVEFNNNKTNLLSNSSSDSEQAILHSLSTIDNPDEFLNYLDENEDNAILVASAAPFEIYSETPQVGNNEQNDCEYFSHTVQEGETAQYIADKYGLSVNTVLWANELKPTDLIKPGMELSIPCLTDAALHTVRKGETLSEIATLHDVSIEKIIEFNTLESAEDIKEGQKLIIPDSILVKELQTRLAEAEAREKEEAAKKAAADAAAKKAAQAKVSQPSSSQKTSYSGGYVLPVAGIVNYSRGIHGQNGIDISGNNGYAVKATASGTVTRATCGWNGGYGCVIDIRHANGTSSRYAHLARGGIYVRVGQSVGAGAVIGKVGSTGRSTGPHLHFELHGARNPYLR